MEVLGWYGATAAQIIRLKSFVDRSHVLSLTNETVEVTIAIRRQQRLKLPDAIIAATALTHKLTLITRNTADFKNIPGLQLINPWEL